MAAAAAKEGGQLEAVIQSNRFLLALALREMADLRVVQNALPHAVELYRQSLEFDDIANTHERLAITYLSLKQPTAALAEAEKVISVEPKNARAWNVKGKASMMKKDFRGATQSLARAISLQGDIETAYSLAMCLLALKEKDRAAMVFRDIIAASGRDRPSLHILFGRGYRDANFLKDAVREFRRALELDPKTPHAHYFIGLIGLIQNEWAPLPEIRQEMHAELKYHPRDYLANYVLGVFASVDKEYQTSDRYLKVAAEEQPQTPEPWLYLGLNAFMRREQDVAEAALRRSVELTGSDEARSHYQIRKAYVALGRILIQSGRKDEAAIWLAKARSLQARGLVESQQTIAEVFSSSGVGMGAVMPYISPESEEKAVTGGFVDATAKLEPAALAKANLIGTAAEAAERQEKQLREILAVVYNDLGSAEARQKDFSLAAKYFQEAEKWNPEIPNLMRNLGLAAAKVNDHETAVRTLSRQLATDPADKVTRALLGISYFMTERFAEAAATIEPLGEAAASDPALGYPWAASLMRLGKPVESGAVLKQLETKELSPQVLLLLAQLWNDLGEPSRAVDDYKRALAVSPRLRGVHYQAGLAWLRAGKPDAAAEEFKAELERDPGNQNARYNLGFIYLQKSQTELARNEFESVVASDNQHANAQYQLGKLLLDEGQAKQAIEHLEIAARLSPEVDYVHYQLQAAYRKDDRLADAERELQIYKEVKAKNREKQLLQPTPDQVAPISPPPNQ